MNPPAPGAIWHNTPGGGGYWLIPVTPLHGAALAQWRREEEEAALIRIAEGKSRRSRERASAAPSSDDVPGSWFLFGSGARA